MSIKSSNKLKESDIQADGKNNNLPVLFCLKQKARNEKTIGLKLFTKYL